MRRHKAIKRGRPRRFYFVHLLAAGGLGYLLGGWHTAALRDTEPSASETVAVRFPETSDSAATALRAPVAAAAARRAGDNVELSLLNPEPMVPQARVQTAAAAAQQADRQTPVAAATIDGTASVSMAVAPATAKAAAAKSTSEANPAVAAIRRPVANRQDYMLNDAQIASIKARLNLTPDQEAMWPSVEAALRNMAYKHGQPSRERDASVTQSAAVDPNAVQGLKSAATPLIMSFNAEQKEEVRNLVHVMGLDQLASQF